MITIPGVDKLLYQTNQSSILGNVYATKNIDTDSNEGVIQLGKRMLLNTATADVSELTSYPVGFKYFASAYWTVAGASGTGYPFKASAITGNFTKVVNGGSISGLVTTFDSIYSDIEITGFGANTELNISTASGANIYWTQDGLTWNAMGAGGAGSPMMMCFYASRGYVTKNGYQIQSWDSSHTVASPSSTTSNSNSYAVNLPDSSLKITWLRPTTKGIFIGTVNVNGGKGYVYFWDGVSTQVNSQFRMKSGGALSALIENDVPLIMDSNGSLLDWNGGTFLPLDNIYRKMNKPLFNPYSTSNQRFIHPNGMSIIKDKPHLLLDLTNYDVSSHLGTQEDCNPSGIWIFDRETKSLKNKYSFGLSKSGGTVTDYGAFRIFGAGGISDILTAQSPITTNGTFLAGCSYYTDATTTTSGIFYDDNNDTLQKAGYFVSSIIQSGADRQSITDTWGKIYAFHKKFLSASDRIVIKYRTVEDVPTEGAITWTNSTSFTTALDLSTYSIGDEVEVLSGIGSGLCSHITAIQATSGGYMVDVDQTYTSATGTSRARFAKWTKAGTIQDLVDFDEVSAQTSSTFVQIKVFMIWSGRNELYKTVITNQVSQKAE